MTLYQILKIKKNASQEQIKKAYYKLAKQYHPDKYDGDSDQFKTINLAYETLIDTDKRKEYDLTLKEGETDNSSPLINKLFKTFKDANYNQIKVYFFNLIHDPKNIKLFMNTSNYDDLFNMMGELSFQNNNILATENSELGTETERPNYIIHTDLKEVYLYKFKVIKLGNAGNIEYEIPLNSNRVVLQNENIIIDIVIDNFYNYKIIDQFDLKIKFPITLYQLFNGITFKFIHLDDSIIELNIDAPFKNGFDGDKLVYKIKNHGIPIDKKDGIIQRGDLYVHLVLQKSNDFNKLLFDLFN